ncbi:MAG: hypothetical protein M3444_21065 [Acidobacteriota bacterium]|nr:hypothetical protein [Acidobacteriota bacterium]
MTLREIKKSLRALNSRQLIKLDAWLHELMDAAESKKQAAPWRRLVEEHKTVNKTYRLEEVRCGKKNCHCVEGRLHGPYWYAYWTEGGGRGHSTSGRSCRGA